MVTRILLFVLMAIAGLLHAGDSVVLTEQTPWRVWPVSRSMMFGSAQAPISDTVMKLLPCPAPPANWASPDYLDHDWMRLSGSLFGRNVLGSEWGSPTIYGPKGTGGAYPRTVAALFLRNQFLVPDPKAVTALALSVEYRGGLVVYLNGEEVHRSHLAAGTLEPKNTLADLPIGEDYPKELFALGNVKWTPEQMAARTRIADKIALPVAQLRAGSNVIAIAIYRSVWGDQEAIRKLGTREGYASYNIPWTQCGFNGCTLTVTPPTAIPSRVSALSEVTVVHADQTEQIRPTWTPPLNVGPLRPMQLVVPKDGFASAQVVACGPQPLGAVQATLSELKGAAGAIPASAVQVRFAVRKTPTMAYEAPFCDVLVPTSPTDQALVPVWVTVQPPAATAPDVYKGTLRVLVGGKEFTVPVEVTVSPWTMPAAKDRWAFMDLNQSPQTLADTYRLKPWSKEHLAMLEKAMAMQKDLANRSFYVSALRPDWFGERAPHVTFTRKGTDWEPDFTHLDLHIEAWKRVVGYPPTYVIINAYRFMMNRKDYGGQTAGLAVFGAWERKPDGTLAEVEVPMISAAGEALWSKVVSGIEQRVVKAGWNPKSVCIGTVNDEQPPGAYDAFWKKCAPNKPWHHVTHYPGPNRGHSLAIMPIFPNLVFDRDGFNNMMAKGWMPPTDPGYRVLTSCRSELGEYVDLACWRATADTAIQGNVSGIGRIGLDFWPLASGALDKKGKPLPPAPIMPWIDDAARAYGGTTPKAMTAPGPDGPLATVRYELMREGLQEAEARITIERAKSAGKSGGANVDALLHERMAWHLMMTAGVPQLAPLPPQMGPNWPARTRALFQAASEAKP